MLVPLYALSIEEIFTNSEEFNHFTISTRVAFIDPFILVYNINCDSIGNENEIISNPDRVKIVPISGRVSLIGKSGKFLVSTAYFFSAL